MSPRPHCGSAGMKVFQLEHETDYEDTKRFATTHESGDGLSKGVILAEWIEIEGLGGHHVMQCEGSLKRPGQLL